MTPVLPPEIDWDLGELDTVEVKSNYKTFMQKLLDYLKANKVTVIIGGVILTIVAILIFKKK